MRTDKFRKIAANTSSPAQVPTTSSAETFVSYEDLPNHIGTRYSRVHVRRLIQRGLFPTPALLSANRIAWRLSDLQAWIASRPLSPIPEPARPAA
jgi:predicted DNA-binding transcriptional regulator AlpA